MQEDYITFSLDLPEFIVQDIEVTETEMIIQVQKAIPYGVCPECNQITDQIHQNDKYRYVQDLPVQNHTVWLKVLKRRFFCPFCEKVFTERFDSFTGKKRRTDRLTQHIMETSRGLSHKRAEEVLNKEGIQVSRHTIAFILHQQAETKHQKAPGSGAAIGLDDFSLKKREKYATVVSDLKGHRVVDVLEGRDKRSIRDYLKKLALATSILFVVMDMWKAYYHAVREALPEAVIIIDKFHVLKVINEALNTVRKRVQRHPQGSTERMIYEVRGYLWRRPEKLTREQKRKLKKVLSLEPVLAKAYSLKCQFWGWYEYRYRKVARKHLDDWCTEAIASGLPEFIEAAGTLRRWEEPILNYFGPRWTNGYTEGVNNKIKVIKRRGYGCRNFQNFRCRILLEAA